MSTVLSIALWLAVVAAVAWVFRFAGQKLTQTRHVSAICRLALPLAMCWAQLF